MRRLLILAAALPSLVAAGCALQAPAPAAAASQAELGHVFVLRACAGCHAVEPGMESTNSHAPKFADLAQQRSDADLTAALTGIARRGHVEMPPIYITPDEIGQVVAYMRSLTGRSA